MRGLNLKLTGTVFKPVTASPLPSGECQPNKRLVRPASTMWGRSGVAGKDGKVGIEYEAWDQGPGPNNKSEKEKKQSFRKNNRKDARTLK